MLRFSCADCGRSVGSLDFRDLLGTVPPAAEELEDLNMDQVDWLMFGLADADGGDRGVKRTATVDSEPKSNPFTGAKTSGPSRGAGIPLVDVSPTHGLVLNFQCGCGHGKIEPWAEIMREALQVSPHGGQREISLAY